MAPLAQPGITDPLGRFDWRGLAVLLAVLAALATARADLALQELDNMFGHGRGLGGVDGLLAGLGAFFLVCVSFDVRPRHDAATVAAGLVGGALIETWGTRTGLWHYYTGERPPLWILPAWGMSALANDRMLRAWLAVAPAAWRERVADDARGTAADRAAYSALTLVLVAAFAWWSRPALLEPYTLLIATVMLWAFWRPGYPRYALCLFACAIGLGILLEIWGTTRHCWNYYDGKTPSPFPILAHGMAAVCFWRMKRAARALLARRPG